MSQNTQPKQYDAVLGGRAMPPTGGVVLGGLAGAKQWLLVKRATTI